MEGARGNLALASIVGQIIEDVWISPPESTEGPELPGVCGDVWWYADLLVRLRSGAVLALGTRDGDLLPELPPGASPGRLLSDTGETCIGRRIVDLLATPEGETSLFLVLEGGTYLEHSHLPGGSTHIFGSFSEWEPEGLREEAVSLISGERRAWESLANH